MGRVATIADWPSRGLRTIVRPASVGPATRTVTYPARKELPASGDLCVCTSIPVGQEFDGPQE